MPEWVYLDTHVLKAAREGAGLSYESMARQVPVSSKTWERYEKAGRVPRHLVRKVAEILGLEIEQPQVGPLIVREADPAEEPDLRRVLGEIRGIRRELREVLEIVEELQSTRAPALPDTGRVP